MTSLSDLARKAGLSPLVTRNEAAFERFAALHKAEVVQELCAGVEPVAWLNHYAGKAPVIDSAATPGALWSDPLYPATTVAALQARVAELEKWQESAFRAHPNIDLDIEYSRRN